MATANQTQAAHPRGEAGSVRLTARDLAIFADLQAHRVLPARLIAWRHFPGDDGRPEGRPKASWAVERRLLALTRVGLLARTRRPVRMGDGSAEYVYTLSAAGRAALAHGRDVVLPPTVTRGPADILFEDHTVAAAQVWAALATACDRTENLCVERWLSESEIRRLAARRQAEDTWGDTPRPDGTGLLVLDGRHRARVYVEVDRHTASHKDLEAKARQYDRYLRVQRDQDANAANTAAPPQYLLCVALGERRLAHALDTFAAAIDPVGPLGGHMLGALLGDMTPDRILDQAVWTVAGAGARRRLVQARLRPR